METTTPKNKKTASERKSTKVGLYLEQNDIEYCLDLADGVSVGKGIVNLLNRMRSLEGEGIFTLRGLYTSEEWQFLAVIQRTNQVIAELLTDRNALIEIISNHKSLNMFTEMYGVDLSKLLAKVSLMNSLQTMALNMRIRRLWQRYPLDEDELTPIEFAKWAASLN